MELFFSDNIEGGSLTLSEEESRHCIKVLRHRPGDEIAVIDGEGLFFRCRITDAGSKAVRAEILETEVNWGGHGYHLEMAVCPTKNADRYEWFAEKACETGIDRIVPVIGDHSERRQLKTDRLKKILLSAAKQSLKGRVPEVAEALSVREYADRMKDRKDCLKLIACCFEDEGRRRVSVMEALDAMPRECCDMAVLIGPEGDFSREEVNFAIQSGFIPVHLGPSRLRIETAALTAVFAVYSHFCLIS